nr:hypothetical protein GCM10020092_084270 [Actinoplanes digitatis]
MVCDVGDAASVDAAVATVAARFGRLDILVNNAGIGATGDVTANGDDEWHRVLNINVVGIARMSRAALPLLLASPSAAIVNTCSVVASVGVPQRALYAASKGAVAALTLAMAADHVREGVRVNAVLPGTADTPWVERLLAAADDPAAAGAALRARQPIGRAGQRGRDRAGDRLPGEPARRLDHGHAARGRRRHGRATAAEIGAQWQVPVPESVKVSPATGRKSQR